MCIAILQPAGLTIDDATLRRCFERNNDGAGFMYAHEGRVVVRKGFFTVERFIAAYHEDVAAHGADTAFGIHFRIATSGKVDKDNGHPHRISRDCALIHNGIFSRLVVPKDSAESDTAIFVRGVLSNLPPDWREYSGVEWLIDAFCGSSNKLVFLWGDGQHLIVNDKAGEWHEGCWYSNGSYKEKYYTGRGSYSSYGGYCSNSYSSDGDGGTVQQRSLGAVVSTRTDYERWENERDWAVWCQSERRKGQNEGKCVAWVSNGIVYSYNEEKKKYVDSAGKTWWQNNPVPPRGSRKDKRTNTSTSDSGPSVVGFTPVPKAAGTVAANDAAPGGKQEAEDSSGRVYRAPTKEEMAQLAAGEVTLRELCLKRSVSFIAMRAMAPALVQMRMNEERGCNKVPAAGGPSLDGGATDAEKVERLVSEVIGGCECEGAYHEAECRLHTQHTSNGEPCEECGQPVEQGSEPARYGHCNKCWDAAFQTLTAEERQMVQVVPASEGLVKRLM